MDEPVTREWRPAWPCPVAVVLAPLRHGQGDPTYRITPDGAHWRGIRTPEGPATLEIAPDRAAGVVTGRAWGAGADWALHSLPRMLGAHDDPAGFVAHHEALARATRRHPHLRIGASGLVLESLVPAVIEQKVTGQEAFAAFRRLVLRYGEAAPGPGAGMRLWVQPTAAQLRAIPSWEWLRLPVDRARSQPVVRAAMVADSLERAGQEAPEEFDRRIRTIPGIGIWTSAEVRARALGDADAVSFGDYHVPREIGWALIGQDVDDDGLAELLAPYAGHRHRVQRLVQLAGPRRPRHGARMAPRTHLPVR